MTGGYNERMRMKYGKLDTEVEGVGRNGLNTGGKQTFDMCDGSSG